MTPYKKEMEIRQRIIRAKADRKILEEEIVELKRRLEELKAKLNKQR